jgi:hypothetical protein
VLMELAKSWTLPWININYHFNTLQPGTLGFGCTRNWIS